jgi:AraC-like DNA-binding protein
MHRGKFQPLALKIGRRGAFASCKTSSGSKTRSAAGVLANPAVGSHNAETLAAALNISARSLHRQLQEEGASLQQLKDEVRFEKAKELLLRTSKPIKQAAESSGFRNEKSFIRTFRVSVGASPREFRSSMTGFST